MQKIESDRSQPNSSTRWEGLAEIDRAIRDNRLMEYRIKKSWADPWGRKLTMLGVSAIVLVFAYLIGASFGMW